jgi:cytochrome b
MQKILVWDWPVRLGHWLMVGGFTLAWLTGDSETFRLVHVIAGATVLGVATFRLPWGFIGSRYARFVDFVRGPAVKTTLQPAPAAARAPCRHLARRRLAIVPRSAS